MIPIIPRSNPLSQPLSDIFSSNHPIIKSPFKPPVKPEQNPATATQDEKEIDTPKQHATTVKDGIASKLNSFPTYNTDSGYHGLSDDEDAVLASTKCLSQSSTQPLETLPHGKPVARLATASPSADRRTTEGSFHSAQENLRLRGDTVEPYVDAPEEIEPDEQTPRPKPGTTESQLHAPSPIAKTEKLDLANVEPENSREEDPMILDNNFDDIGSPSDGSTPDRPLIRKSSLSFASLPAREPLMTKKSMGGHRISRTSHIDIAKLSHPTRPSHFEAGVGAIKTVQVIHDTNEEGSKMDWEKTTDLDSDDMDTDSTATRLHHKSSTQRLHEKISLLGKMQPSRPTKSIPAVAHLAASQLHYPELASTKDEAPKPGAPTGPDAQISTAEKEDLTTTLRSPPRPNISKSHTTDIMENILRHDELFQTDKNRDDTVEKHAPSPLREQSSPRVRMLPGHSISASVSSPSLHRSAGWTDSQRHGSPIRETTQENTTRSTTPLTSPKRYDGALNMSKSKLQSLMKTAKGLFTSSAGVSAAAKLEALSPGGSRSHPNLSAFSAITNGSKGGQNQTARLDHDIDVQTFSHSDTNGKDQTHLQDETGDVRRHQLVVSETLSDQLKAASNTQRTLRDRTIPLLPEKTTGATALRTSPRKAQQPVRQATGESGASHSNDSDFKFPMPPSQAPVQPPKQNDRRPVRPTREATQKPKPQPVSIRVASTLSRTMPLSSTVSLSSSVHASNVPSAPTQVQEPVPTPAITPATIQKQQTLSKKISTSSLQTSSSTSSLKSSVSSQTQRKTQAAEKKKQVR